MKKIQMNKKGITLTSLIIYITIMFVVLAIIMRVSTYYTKNMSDVADTSFEQEFEKFNMYMLQETNKSGNYVKEVSEEQNTITFTDGNTITFQKEAEDERGLIYFNGIKICEGIESCEFLLAEDETLGKTTITVDLSISGTTDEVKYVIPTPIYTSRLPEGLQEVEYIESNGTQYIDTEFIPDSNTSVFMGFEFDSTKTVSSVMCGAQPQAGTSQKFNIWLSGGNGIGFQYGKTDTNKIQTLSSNTYIEVEARKNTVWLNGVLIKTVAEETFSTGATMYIFARRVGTTNQYYDYSTYKLYKMKIWDKDELVRDFVPCYIESNNKTGVYDLITRKFYACNGTNEFNIGNNINHIKTTRESKENEYIIKPRIPKAYQEVEYISTVDNGAYIDTGVIPNNSFGFEIKLKTKDAVTDRAIVGVKEKTNTNSRYWIGFKNNQGYCGWNDIYPNENKPTINNNTYYTIQVNYKNNRAYVVDNVPYQNDLPQLTTFTKPFCLMGRNNAGTYGAREQTMKYAIFTSGEEITHYFIPCYRKADYEVGLYDIVNDEFYTNAGSTGSFLKGPDVTK